MEQSPIEAAAWMKAEREQRGWSTTRLANTARRLAHEDDVGIKLTQQSISKFEQGTTKKLPPWFKYVRQALGNEEPVDNVVHIWDRIPEARRGLASEVLKTFADYSG